MSLLKPQWQFKKCFNWLGEFISFGLPFSFMCGGLAWTITNDLNFGWFVCASGVIATGFMSYSNTKYGD